MFFFNFLLFSQFRIVLKNLNFTLFNQHIGPLLVVHDSPGQVKVGFTKFLTTFVGVTLSILILYSFYTHSILGRFCIVQYSRGCSPRPNAIKPQTACCAPKFDLMRQFSVFDKLGTQQAQQEGSSTTPMVQRCLLRQ